MLKIRLQRVGRKNDPSFRAVCVDSRKGPKAGKHTEVLGSYDPKRDYIAINDERVKHWISNGAQVSDTMHNLLVKEGIIKGKKIHVAKEKKKDLSAARLNDEVGQEASAEAEAPAEEARIEVKEEEPKEETPTEAPKEEEKPKEETKPASTDSSPTSPNLGESQGVEQEIASEKKEVV